METDLNAATKVPVNLGDRSYEIVISPGVIFDPTPIIASTVSTSHLIVVSDSNVAPIYLDNLKQRLSASFDRVDSMVVPAGEPSKSVTQCDQLWQQMIQLKTDRKSAVVALGGGVVGDLAGFLAASFTRGLPFVQIPTSLLAQVDSSVGGKVGINLPQAKNMVGAFWQPRSVVIDPLVLNTLDEANYRAGMAEVIKYGAIMDEQFFQFLESSVEKINARDPETLTKIIAQSCRCKAQVVEEDEHETTGRRAILNYGHTYGHAIEAVFGYGRFLHGEAIAIGMTCAARLARQLGMIDQDFCDRQTKLFLDVGLPVECPNEKHDQLMEAMTRDKKVSGGKLKLILPTRMGHVELVDAPESKQILASWKHE
jgi:3-dehydroquinate synthase